MGRSAPRVRNFDFRHIFDLTVTGTPGYDAPPTSGSFKGSLKESDKGGRLGLDIRETVRTSKWVGRHRGYGISIFVIFLT